MVNICGIAGIHVFNPDKAPRYFKMENAIDSLLSAIDHRGGDATGFVAVGEDNVEWQKASCDAFTFYKERRNIPLNTRSVLLHTRMATQGHQAFPENNHPVRRGSVYVVHNGHVYNDKEIFKKAKRERYGQVDSEAIAALIAKHGIMNTHKAMEEISGAAAIGVVDETRPGLMVLARGSSSPLMFYRNEDIAIFASTKGAIQRGWAVLYGTPPNEKNIEDIDEGVALYLDNKTMFRKKFEPDDFYMYNKWKNYQYDDGYSQYYSSTPVKKYSSGFDKQAWGDRKLDNVTICQHGCIDLDCEICNPDDPNGSYLPAVIRKGTEDHWLSAEQCQLCNAWFAEDELREVTDWDSVSWKFCEDCCEEMSDVLIDTKVPTTIHRASMDETIRYNF